MTSFASIPLAPSGPTPLAALQTTPATPADEAALRLTRAIGAGDRGALAAFYEEWFDRALHLAAAFTRRDEAFCLDVAQDSMLRAARAIPALETFQDIERWMARVIHTAALDLLKAEARRLRREQAAASQSPQHAADQHASLRDEIETLTAKLRNLPAPDAHLLSLRFFRDLTHAQTAHAEGSTIGGVHGRIRRILASLRPRADDHEGGRS